jgi:NADH-quinone oxidoreductase subunit J
MTPGFIVAAILTAGGALAAITLRNLVHCVLSVTVAFLGLAALFLGLHAEFVGFAQILVYVGAVAILILFAILLTGGGDPVEQRFAAGWSFSLAAVGVLLGVLLVAVFSSHSLEPAQTAVPPATVRQIGIALMTRWLMPLQAIGLLLTAALVGAVLLAKPDKAAPVNQEGREP